MYYTTSGVAESYNTLGFESVVNPGDACGSGCVMKVHVSLLPLLDERNIGAEQSIASSDEEIHRETRLIKLRQAWKVKKCSGLSRLGVF